MRLRRIAGAVWAALILAGLTTSAGRAQTQEITSLVTTRIGILKEGFLDSYGRFQTAHFTPDGRYLFTSSRGKCQIWSVPGLKSVLTLPGHETTAQPAPVYDRHMRLVATTVYRSNKQVTTLWTLPGWKKGAVLEGVAWGRASPDGQHLAAQKGGRTGLWALPEGKFLTFLPPEEKPGKGNKPKVERRGPKYSTGSVLGFHPSRPLLATEEYMTEDELKENLKLEQLVLEHRKVSKNMRYMSLQIALWSLPDAQLRGTLPGAHGLLGFDRNGNLACYGPTGGVHLWSVPEGKRLASFGDDEPAIPWPVAYSQNHYFGALSPDGRHVAYANDRGTRMWSVADGRLTASIDARTFLWFRMSFSPDGCLLATTDVNGKCRFWSVPSGKLLATLDDYAMHMVAFSPDGRIFATGHKEPKDKKFGTALWLYAPGDRLDWSLDKSGDVGKAEVTLAARQVVYAGDEFWLDLTLRNTGKGDITQVWADVQGDALHFKSLGCMVGRVKAGDTIQRRMSVFLPPDHPAGGIKGSLVVHQADGTSSTTVAHPFDFEVKPLPRRDFTLLAKPAQLRLGRGKALAVPILVKNQTGAAIADLKVAVRVLEGLERVTVKPPSLDFGTVPDQMNAERLVELQAKVEAPAGRMMIELRATDDRGHVFAVQQFVMELKE